MKYIGDMFLICAAVLAIAYFVQKKVAPEKRKKSAFIIKNTALVLAPVAGICKLPFLRSQAYNLLESVADKKWGFRHRDVAPYMEMFDQYAFWLFVAVAVLSVLLILLVVAKVKLVSEHIWVWAIFMWFCLQCSSLYMGFLTFNKFFDFTQFTAREAFFISLLLGIPILICENIKRRREK